jgi:hypothetical protein
MLKGTAKSFVRAPNPVPSSKIPAHVTAMCCKHSWPGQSAMPSRGMPATWTSCCTGNRRANLCSTTWTGYAICGLADNPGRIPPQPTAPRLLNEGCGNRDIMQCTINPSLPVASKDHQRCPQCRPTNFVRHVLPQPLCSQGAATNGSRKPATAHECSQHGRWTPASATLTWLPHTAPPAGAPSLDTDLSAGALNSCNAGSC